MKVLDEVTNTKNIPHLIPNSKQTERNLLSIFMALLEHVPVVRGNFLAMCGWGAGRTGSYTSLMETNFQSSKLPDFRPDGLIVSQRGSSSWSAFIEAKAEAKAIRPDQIQNYLDLASSLDVDAVITISNEFALSPDDIPYFIAANKRRKKDIYHFAWADIRTFLELELHSADLNTTEQGLLREVLAFLWRKNVGVSTFDQMPQEWSKFVQSSGIGIGFSSKTPGITEIVHGWQQERRDLGSKLVHMLMEDVEIRHPDGARLNADERLKADRKQLAENYILNSEYFIKSSRMTICASADLASCRMSVSCELPPPPDKKARAVVTWAETTLLELELSEGSVRFGWKGRNNDYGNSIENFLKSPEEAIGQQKDAPKFVEFCCMSQSVRRFKSRKFFVEDFEGLVMQFVGKLRGGGLI